MKIQISKIRFNPENPRHFINPDGIDSLAASMKANGQLESVKVRELTAQDTASQGCTGKELAGYELFEGERRLRAAMKLGWTEIEAEVFTGGREDFSLKGFMNNNGEPYHWLDKYRYIADYMEKHPDLTQIQIADRVALSQQEVSNAIKALSILNKSAQEMIYRNSVKSKDWQLPVAVVMMLTALAKGQPNDQDTVEQALKVVFDRKMTVKQAEKLVEWVNKGNAPETFPADGKTSKVKGAKNQRFDPNDPNAGRWSKAPKNIQVRMKPHGYQVIMNLSEPEALMAFYSAMAGLKRLELKERPGQAGDANEFENELPSIYDIAIGKADKDAKRQQEAEALREEVEGEVQGSKAQGVQSEGMVSKFQIPNSENPKLNSLDLVKNILTAASGHTPKTFSGKILKSVAVFLYGLYTRRKQAQDQSSNAQKDEEKVQELNAQGSKAQEIQEVESSGMLNAKSQIPNGSAIARNTILIAMAVAVVAGAFVLRLGMKKIVHAMHINNAYSLKAQKQIAIAPGADNNTTKPAVIARGPYNESSEWKNAMQYFAQGDNASAFMWLEKTREQHGDQAEIYKYMGECEENLGDYTGAVEFDEKYSKMNPGDKEIKAKIEELKSTVAPPEGMEEPTQEQSK